MNRYRVLKVVGSGAMGQAVLARRKEDNKSVIVKQVPMASLSPEEKKEAINEVNCLASLRHPYIVSYQESFEERGQLCIVMDYADGGDMKKTLEKQRGQLLKEDQILDWFVQICLALKHCHDRKMLHRDLKTENIFMNKDSTILLGDFGIARVMANTMQMAATACGTPIYMSPELCQDQPYNNKSDIWSLGCCLYEMATLEYCFQARNMRELVNKIIHAKYKPIPTRFSSTLRSLVGECLNVNADARPSVNEILKKPILRTRISKFMTRAELQTEFDLGSGGSQAQAQPQKSRAPPAVPKQTPAQRRQSRLVNQSRQAGYGRGAAAADPRRRSSLQQPRYDQHRKPLQRPSSVSDPPHVAEQQPPRRQSKMQEDALAGLRDKMDKQRQQRQQPAQQQPPPQQQQQQQQQPPQQPVPTYTSPPKNGVGGGGGGDDRALADKTAECERLKQQLRSAEQNFAALQKSMQGMRAEYEARNAQQVRQEEELRRALSAVTSAAATHSAQHASFTQRWHEVENTIATARREMSQVIAAQSQPPKQQYQRYQASPQKLPQNGNSRPYHSSAKPQPKGNLASKYDI